MAKEGEAEAPTVNIGTTLDEEPRRLKDQSLISIHSCAIRRILLDANASTKADSDQEIMSLQQKQTRLRNLRISLQADLEEARNANKYAAVLDDLLYANNNTKRRKMNHCAMPPHIEPNLAHRMHSLRKRRNIVASHRMAGISILPCPSDTNLLGIRLDICNDLGVYVAKHVLFFDIVKMSTFSKQQHQQQQQTMCRLRLAQHTVPAGVPLSWIVDTTLGSPAVIPKTGEAFNATIMPRLEECIGQIYDACFIHACRKRMGSYLQENTREEECSTTDGYYFAIQHLIYSDSYDRFQFDILWRSNRQVASLQRLHISLTLTDYLSIKPTIINVERACCNDNDNDNPGLSEPHINGTRVVVEDPDVVLKDIKTLFRTHSIEQAIQELIQL